MDPAVPSRCHSQSDTGTGDGADPEDRRAQEVLEALGRQTVADGEADLSIVGTASATGSEIRWTATVRNGGPDQAEGPITVIHTIGSTFELVSTAGTGWDCELRRAAGTIACELDEDLASGQRRRLGLVTRSDDASPGTSIPSTMSVIAGTADPDLGNNAINVTAISGPADDADADDFRSRSTGAAGPANTDVDDGDDPTGTPDAGADDPAVSTGDEGGAAAMTELPRTGSGLVVALGAVGVALCLAGRRLMAWSARAETRQLLVAANLD